MLVVAVVAAACYPSVAQKPAGAPGAAVQRVSAPRGGESATAWTWYRTPARTSGRNLTFGVHRTRVADPRGATLLIVPGGHGWQFAHLTLAKLYASRGWDVAVGCYFVNPQGMDCWNAPAPTGQSGAAQQELSALVRAVRLVVDQPVGIVGHSRGAGVAALRAARGYGEPIVAVSGPLTQRMIWGHPGDRYPFYVVPRIDAPTYVWSAADDPMTPPPRQSDWFVLAMQIYDQDVRYRVVPRGSHSFLFDGRLGKQFVDATTNWFAANL